MAWWNRLYGNSLLHDDPSLTQVVFDNLPCRPTKCDFVSVENTQYRVLKRRVTLKALHSHADGLKLRIADRSTVSSETIIGLLRAKPFCNFFSFCRSVL